MSTSLNILNSFNFLRFVNFHNKSWEEVMIKKNLHRQLSGAKILHYSGKWRAPVFVCSAGGTRVVLRSIKRGEGAVLEHFVIREHRPLTTAISASPPRS